MNEKTLGTWRNPPLAYVVAEVGISPHYSVAQAVPSIQHALRDSYPRTDEGIGLELALAVGAPSQSGVPDRIWRLFTSDNRRGVNLSTRAIGLHVTSYHNFLEFAKELGHVLEVVEVSGLNPHVERVGLRYIDYILPSEGHEPVDYLRSALRGVTPPGVERAQTAMWVANYPFDGFTVNSRIAAPLPPGMILPLNFSAMPLAKPTTMIAAEQRAKNGQSFGVIDTDCIKAINQPFKASELATNFEQMHERVSVTFKSVISELALEEWTK